MDVTGREAAHKLRLRNALRWAVGLALAGIAVWILVRGLDWSAIAGALIGADYRWVSAGVIGALVTLLTRALRWKALLNGDRVSLWSSATAILVGQVVNTGLPVLRSGDFARAAWTSQRAPVGVTQSLGSIVLEKVWDLLALCVTGVALLFLIPLPAWFEQSTWGVVVAVILGLVVLWAGLHWQAPLLAVVSRLMHKLPERLSGILMPQLQELVLALDTIRQPRASAAAGLWTVCTWVVGGFINWSVMRAFGVSSITGATLLLATLMLGASAVPTPGRVGVFEGIAVVSLTQFGVDANLALAIGLVLHLVVMGPPLVLAALLGLANILGWRPNHVSRADAG